VKYLWREKIFRNYGMTLFTEKLLNYGQSKYDRPVTNNEIELLTTKKRCNHLMDGKRKLAIKNN